MPAIPVTYSAPRSTFGLGNAPNYYNSPNLAGLVASRAFGSGNPPAITDQYGANPNLANTAPAAPAFAAAYIPPSVAATNTRTDPTSGAAIDFSTDPILQKVIAMARANALSASAGADAAAKQAFINSGFGDVVNNYRFGQPADELLGIGDSTAIGDPATAAAATNNPFSVAAQLAKAHGQQNVGIDQNQNAQNLFYSSNRSNLLGDEATNYLGHQYGAQQDLAGQLAGIAQNLISARQGGEGQVLSEEEAAYMRALGNQLPPAAGAFGPTGARTAILHAFVPTGYSAPTGAATVARQAAAAAGALGPHGHGVAPPPQQLPAYLARPNIGPRTPTRQGF